MNNWYECSVRYEKISDSGAAKRSAESYLVDALSVTEAESRLTEEIIPFSSNGEITISSLRRAKIAELFLSDKPEDDKYYRCKVLFIVLDEKNGVEKNTPVTMIVQSASLAEAVAIIEKEMNRTTETYSIASVVETSILDVFKHED